MSFFVYACFMLPYEKDVESNKKNCQMISNYVK